MKGGRVPFASASGSSIVKIRLLTEEARAGQERDRRTRGSESLRVAGRTGPSGVPNRPRRRTQTEMP